MKIIVLTGILLFFACFVKLEPVHLKQMSVDEITVSVSGAVEEEGNQKLPMYATVEEALQAAKPSADADLSVLNQTQVLKDHDVIVVPEKKAEEEKQRISINTGTLEELMTLPGIGKSTAEKIIAYRNENGSFQALEDLQKVKGIGKAKYEKIMADICL